MKNPFNKQSDSTDIDTEAELDTGEGKKRFLDKVKTKKTKLSKDQTAVDNKKPTIETHGFDYSESEDGEPTDANNFNPYDYNETDDASTPFTAVQGNDSNWYSLNGRIGRVKLLAYSAIWGLFISLLFLLIILVSGGMMAIATSFAMGTSLMSIPLIIMLLLMFPILIYSIIVLPRRRLHDINKSGWWLLLYLVPIASLILMYWIYFKTGDEGINDYGLPPRPNTQAEKVLGTIGGLLIVLSFLIPFIAPLFLGIPDDADFALPDSDTQQPDGMVESDSLDNDSLEGNTVEGGSVEGNTGDELGGWSEDNVESEGSDDVTLNSNEQLDPEVQAEIDAALGRDANGDKSNNSATSSASNSGSNSSYEEFIKASETPILIDRNTPDDDVAIDSNESDTEVQTAPVP